MAVWVPLAKAEIENRVTHLSDRHAHEVSENLTSNACGLCSGALQTNQMDFGRYSQTGRQEISVAVFVLGHIVTETPVHIKSSTNSSALFKPHITLALLGLPRCLEALCFCCTAWMNLSCSNMGLSHLPKACHIKV